MMQQQQLLHSSWQYYNNTIDSSPLDMDVFMGDCEFSSSLTTTDDSSDVSSILYFPSNSTSPDDYLIPLPSFSDDVPFMFASEQYSPNSDDLRLISSDEVLSNDIEDVFDWMQEMEGSEVSLPSSSKHNFSQEDYEGSLGSSMKFMDNSSEITSVQSSIVLPMEDTEVDNQLSIPSLLKAYGEAIEIEQVELAEVIMRRIKEKVSPMGTIIERIAYYFFQALDKQGDYLKQEANKNYGAALSAFYQKLPNGRFAHLTANLAILEGIPRDVETIHIIDFDIGDGIQWPALFEAIGCGRTVRLTSIKWKDDCDSNSDFPQWSFQDTKRRLYYHSQSLGLKLKVEEMEMEELVSKMMSVKTINAKKEWLVFNCMVGLPHMGRQRSRRLVSDFLKVAKELISSKCSNTSRGIITLGEGDGVKDRMRNCSGFGSFLDEYLVHFHAMFQSMQGHFPSHLAEAQIAMESLFVAPFISSLSCYEMWEEIKKGSGSLKSVNDLESWRFSRENVLQAKEIVKEGNSMYSVRIEEGHENIMSLEYLGTSLVKVSSWRLQ